MPLPAACRREALEQQFSHMYRGIRLKPKPTRIDATPLLQDLLLRRDLVQHFSGARGGGRKFQKKIEISGKEMKKHEAIRKSASHVIFLRCFTVLSFFPDFLIFFFGSPPPETPLRPPQHARV